MLDVKGKFTKDCKVYAETIEDEALSTIYRICEHPAFKDAKIRIMPDCHQGKGIVIGFTCPVGNYVNPNHIGVDIGCQMTSIELSKKLDNDDYVSFEQHIRSKIPTGFNIQSKKVYEDKKFYKFLNKEYNKARSNWPEMIEDVGTINEKFITNLCKRIGMDEGIFYKSIGSVGGGNHFIEYGETYDGRAFFTVHCGSRNFGVKVANYWNNVAKRAYTKVNVDAEIKKIKATEPDRAKWHDLIAAAKENVKLTNFSDYVSGDNLKGYLSDMVIAQAYAHFNHEMIMEIVKSILLKYKIMEIDRINTIHNYISFEDHIIRKGAIQSYKGQKMIIPFNMRDGLAICEGKSNNDWNCSAPHGAGRIMSRSAARKNVDVDEFKKSMEGIYSTCVGSGTLDESPMVYKDMNEIVKLIEPTADVLFFVKPKINLKAKDTMED